MLDRRDLLRTIALLSGAAALEPFVAGCANAADSASPPDTDPTGAVGQAGLAAFDISRSKGRPDLMPDTAQSITALAADLHQQIASTPGNVLTSPYSVAVALAMTRNGAKGQTATEMDQVLRIDDLGVFNDGLNALSQHLESLAGEHKRADGSKASVSLDVANSLWGQDNTTWEDEFLRTLASDYGAGMHLVDYIAHTEAARILINEWTSDTTHGRIPEIIPPDVLDSLTRLVLVNAIYLKAPWESPFETGATKPQPFTLADGSTVQAETMSGGIVGASYHRGSGYQAARLAYAGNGLAMTIVLADDPDLESFEASLDGARLEQVLSEVQPVAQLDLQLPKWTFRTQVALNDILTALGMPTAFDPTAADFSGMTKEEALYISAVLHEAFIAVDEEGTEAAAATAVVVSLTSGVIGEEMIVDHPFLFVIHDVDTLTPLFVGRISDPTS